VQSYPATLIRGAEDRRLPVKTAVLPSAEERIGN
jgi:hypothetical protein